MEHALNHEATVRLSDRGVDKEGLLAGLRDKSEINPRLEAPRESWQMRWVIGDVYAFLQLSLAEDRDFPPESNPCLAKLSLNYLCNHCSLWLPLGPPWGRVHQHSGCEGRGESPVHRQLGIGMKSALVTELVQRILGSWVLEQRHWQGTHGSRREGG